MKNTVLVILTIFVSVIYSSCRKNNKEDLSDVTAAIDNAEAQNVFDGIAKQITELVDSSNIVRAVSVTYSSTNASIWPKIVTIDYGTTNVLGTDGNSRRGKLISTFSKKYCDSNTVVSIALNNYIHNDQLVNGSVTLTNKGRNAAGNYRFAFKVQNAIITTSIGKMLWSANQTREWISGKTSPNYALDDVYLVTGTSSGTSLNGNSYTTLIDIPLLIEPTCTWTSLGSLNVYPKYYSVINLDYGNGTCDALATAIINKKATEILLL